MKELIKKVPLLVYLVRKVKRFINSFDKKEYLVIQKNYQNILKKKIDKVKNGERIKVAFFVTQKQLWCLQSVYDSFKDSELFEVLIVAFPNEEDKIHSLEYTAKDNYEFFYDLKLNVSLGYNKKTKKYLTFEEILPDIIFYDQPFPKITEELSHQETCKKSLVCYVPYGYKVANAYEGHFNMPLQNSCWKVFSESNWHTKQFEKYGKLKGKNVVTSGYPKLDIYNKTLVDNNTWKINNIESKKIIWAPHWSIGSEVSSSTFHTNYNLFKKIARENQNISWIFKPHQRLRSYLEEIGFMTKKEINDYYDFWDSLPNTKFYNESDYFDIFKTSDALITDCGSFLAEYLPTKNPIMLLVNQKSIGYNEVGKKLVENYYKVYDNEDIEKFINDVIINENDYMKEKRLNQLHLVQPNTGGAGKFIVDYIQKELGA